jgi:GNAT superfamily N-acetyltransferase
MEQLTDIQQYHGIVERYRREGCRSNDYLQTRVGDLIARGLLYADCHDSNAYLLERKANCCRMYYYLNDITSPDVLTAPDPVIMLEILYRGNGPFPQAERDYLVAMGFEENLVRDQYAAVYQDLAPALAHGEVEVRPAISVDEVAWAVKMFNDAFDPYSGDYIDESELSTLLQSDQVLMAVDGAGDPLGALHQTVERNVAWISHVAVVPAARGRHVGQALVDAFVERNHTSDKSRYMLWVQQQNAAAVAMYRKKGFRYLNKSTLSLIKQP